MFIHFYQDFHFRSIPDEVIYEHKRNELHSLVMFVLNDFFNSWVYKNFVALNSKIEDTVIGYPEAIAGFNISI